MICNYAFQNLSVLNMGQCTKVSHKALVELVLSLPKLMTLNLTETQCSDEVVTLELHKKNH